ncbi:hypothetical protein QJS10_CPA05g01427 [Acorus calamus]|uniref:Uncharacterized protein n=1 Tax=Acorus calamus TaxID=4465 RepID=A0AAV9EQ91_ACOCL|nr:hypothetical protein QJS10_CPA05g01427 [Acorus calamus]
MGYEKYLIWGTLALKTQCFMWILILDKALTKANQMKWAQRAFGHGKMVGLAL